MVIRGNMVDLDIFLVYGKNCDKDRMVKFTNDEFKSGNLMLNLLMVLYKCNEYFTGRGILNGSWYCKQFTNDQATLSFNCVCLCKLIKTECTL
jgi:hypothetical protein